MSSVKAKFLLFSLLSSLGLNAQTKITFAYDEAGNRVKREIVLTQAQSKQALRAASYSDLVANHQVQISKSSSGNVKVAVPDGSADFDVSVYNVSGQCLFSHNKVHGSVDVDLSRYPNGIYVLAITLGEEKTTWKIMKNN